MNDSTKDKAKGKFNQAAGTAKEKLGKATGDTKMEAEGTGKKLKGKVQETVGNIKKAFKK